jgi:hypothetical protein
VLNQRSATDVAEEKGTAMPAASSQNKRKRSADNSGLDQYPFIGSTEWMEYMEENEIPFKHQSANAVRNKINRFLENSGVKVGKFIETLGSSSKSYYGFMHQTGLTKGTQSATFENALALFAYMEHTNIPFPKKARTAAKPSEKGGANASGAAAARSANTAAAAKKSTKTSSSTHDISNITLPGEEMDAVQVYDTCDEIRRKIAAHLRKDGVTQAAFLRDLVAQFHTNKGPSQLQSRQLSSFRGKKGAVAGCTTPIFYASYIFFEKERIATKAPKTKHREEMEKIWAEKGGFDLEHDGRHGYLCSAGTRPHIDNYGRYSVIRI